MHTNNPHEQDEIDAMASQYGLTRAAFLALQAEEDTRHFPIGPEARLDVKDDGEMTSRLLRTR